MDRRRLFGYILLNVFVSACVTGAILYWYDRNVKATSSAVPIQSGPSNLVQNTPAAGAPVSGSNPAPKSTANVGPQSDIPIEIVSVVGSGDLAIEVVIVRYLGEGELELTNWQLKDENGNIFLFPALILAPNGAVQIHSAAGTNTVVDLYWGLPIPVWTSGEIASLYDASGNLIVTYRVP
ncbi:MAG: lamin tail domain-containing protein [Chloroflexota bacterium]